MKTNFTTLEPKSEIVKKTVFTHFITDKKTVCDSIRTVNGFENVLHIGCDKQYGDVFKCWNDVNEFTIYFGTKGDEFNQ